MAALRFQVLGPVSVVVDGRGASIAGGRKARAVLLALILDVGRAVPVDRIVNDVWGDRPPPSANRVVRSQISRIRHVVGSDKLRAVDHSYVLHADPLTIDAVLFERRVDDVTTLLQAGNTEAAVEVCRSALAMWRGPVFGDLGDEEFVQLEAARLLELRARAVELHFECEVRLGESGQVIGRLQAEAEAFRYRERLWALLMIALAREGRRAEAIRAYDEAGRLLAEIGLEPCAELHDLANHVIREDPGYEAHLVSFE